MLPEVGGAKTPKTQLRPSSAKLEPLKGMDPNNPGTQNIKPPTPKVGAPAPPKVPVPTPPETPEPAPVRPPNPKAPRPTIETNLPDRVTTELPAGEIRTPAENAQARNFFERNREAARKWWEERTGQDWPKNATHDEHPRAVKEGGDPLFIEPGFEGSAKPHMDAGDFQRWGRMGGRPPKPKE